MLKGNKYGIHRVIEPQGVLTQAAKKIDNDMTKRYSNEIICDVISLNIDSASFTQIEEACNKDVEKIGQMILDIVNERGKMQSALYAKLPEDLPEPLALAALDVAGAPAQTAKLVQSGQSVLVLGGAGKSGMLVCYEAMKRVGPTGKVVAMDYSKEGVEELKKMGLCHEAFQASAALPVEVLDKALELNDGREYDVSICCVNVNNCEMSAILPVRDGGCVYFFSMATSFTKAALGAEGVGKDIDMIIGNGYTKGHDKITLQEIRENPAIREVFEKKYV